MIKNYKKQLNIAFLLLFLMTIVTINFFHVEKCIDNNKFCPACHLLNSVLSTAQILFFYLPPPGVTGLLKIFEFFHYKYIAYINPASRSPPLI